MAEPLVGTQEAAEILGRHWGSVKRYARLGQLKPVQKMPGATGAYLFRRVDVERLARKLAADAAKRKDGGG